MEEFIGNRLRNAVNASVLIDRIRIAVGSLLVFIFSYILLQMLRFRMAVQMRLCVRYYCRLNAKLSFYRRRSPSLHLKYLEDRQQTCEIMVRLMLQGLELEALLRFPRLDEPLDIYERYLFLKQQLIEVEQQLRAGHVERIGQGPEELSAENCCDNSSSASDSDSD